MADQQKKDTQKQSQKGDRSGSQGNNPKGGMQDDRGSQKGGSQGERSGSKSGSQKERKENR